MCSSKWTLKSVIALAPIAMRLLPQPPFRTFHHPMPYLPIPQVVTSPPDSATPSFTLEDTLGVEHVLSLGPLMLLPYAAQLLLESGLLRTAATLLMQVGAMHGAW